jgi:adenylate kinase
MHIEWSHSMNIILIGAQGSGKGTQAELLTQEFSICHVASGDLFRKAMDDQTAAGLKAKAYLERGELVPDQLTTAMVLERMSHNDCLSGILLDGFPRTITQAQLLDQNLQEQGHQIDLAIYLEVSRENLIARLSGRLICHAQQHIYHTTTHPPQVAGICDIDGSELYQRSDDQGEAIHKRLDIFFHETIHLLNYYEQQQKLVTVNGDQAAEATCKTIVHVLKDKFDGSSSR